MSRAGKKAFDRCDVKVVEFKDTVYEHPTQVMPGNYVVPLGGLGTVASRPTSPADAGMQYAGSGAALHCPRTEDERVNIHSAYSNHNGRLLALKSVRNLAGELLCRTCRFSTMTPVEVSIERKALADAETERVESFILLEAARAEIRAIGQPELPEKNIVPSEL